MNSSRFLQLDSLRGLAAVTVLILHGMNVTDTWSLLPEFIRMSPLRFLWSGQQAVILFFVLSGFVLALPFLKSNGLGLSYNKFILKRVCRIYIPYLAAIVVGIVARWSFYKNEIAEAWTSNLDGTVILQHLLLIGSFDGNAIDPVVWSLVHEMRISLLFPLIMLFVIRRSWITSLCTGALLSVTAVAIQYSSNFSHSANHTNFIDTSHYVMMFIVGALLAKYRIQLLDFYRRTPTGLKLGVFAAALLCYAYANVFHRFGGVGHYIADYLVSLGGAVFIFSALGSKRLSRVLTIKPLVFVGKISYSLYLYHLIVLLSVSSYYSNQSPVFIWIVSIVLAFTLSTIGYYLVERPSINLSKRITLYSSKQTDNAQFQKVS